MSKIKFKNRTVPFKRKNDGLTNYKKRLNLLKSNKTRLVIRLFKKNIVAQLVNYEAKGDKVLTTCNSTDLKKMGWNYNTGNLPAAYLTGMLLAKKSKELNLKLTDSIIFDSGVKSYALKTKIYAVVKGCYDNGLKVIVDEKAFPEEDRIKGTHIVEFASKSNEVNKLQFSKTKDVNNLSSVFEKIMNELKVKMV